MKIYNLIILDESGSMDHIKQAAIDSVNETLQSIRGAQKENEGQEHFVSFVSFNSSVKTIFDCVSADSVNDLTGRDYEPSGLTALYDAMGISLTALRQRVQSDDKVLVTIVTDGMENASREYSGVAIKAMVDELKARGWIFAYMGANHDVEAAAAHISITNVMHFEASVDGADAMSKKQKSAREGLYKRMSDRFFSAEKENVDFFKDL